MTEAEVKLKAWWVVEFEVDSGQDDMASWLMMHIGALGCEMESSCGAKIRIRATFDVQVLPDGHTGKVVAALEEYGLSPSVVTLRVRELQEEDWLAKWKVGFEPFPVGDKLMVCPAWLKDSITAEERKARAVILIEPGLAFGTGFHATTQFCLGAVERYVPTLKTVIDVGTGSGILAIGAALLNANAQIVAVENDPLACKVARENFELNGVVGKIDLVEGITDDLTASQRMQYDMILSNLTYEDNSALLADYVKLSHPKTKMVFAGILKEKRELMIAALQKHGLRVSEEEVGDMWSGLVAVRE